MHHIDLLLSTGWRVAMVDALVFSVDGGPQANCFYDPASRTLIYSALMPVCDLLALTAIALQCSLGERALP
jgi:hypothetical protein